MVFERILGHMGASTPTTRSFLRVYGFLVIPSHAMLADTVVG